MTAYRVITDHDDLQSVGILTHDNIDQFVTTTQFVIVSGSISSASGSRILRASAGVLITDEGPGGFVTFSIDESYVRSLVSGGSGGTTNFEIVDQEIPTGVINGTNQVFTLQHSPNPPQSLHLFLNGQLQDAVGYNYTLSGSIITFTDDNIPLQNDRIKASYRY